MRFKTGIIINGRAYVKTAAGNLINLLLLLDA